MKRRYMTLALLVLVAIVGVLVFQTHQNTFQIVTIHTPKQPGVYVGIYGAPLNDESTQYDESNVYATKPGTYKLKRGSYTLVTRASNTENYLSAVQAFTLGKSPQSLQPATLKYTESKLSSLLTSQLTTIHNATAQAYPTLSSLYSVSREKLYEQGEWYAATFTPLDTTNYDIVRVVFEKKNEAWVAVTVQPELIISKPVYPQIPDNILTDINN